MSAGLANRRGAEFSARIFSPNFQHADSQCTNFNSNNLRVLSPLVYNIYSVLYIHTLFSLAVTGRRMRTVINIYIGNLALADCIIAIFCIPFQFLVYQVLG